MITLPKEFKELVFKEVCRDGEDYSLKYAYVSKNGETSEVYETPKKGKLDRAFKVYNDMSESGHSYDNDKELCGILKAFRTIDDGSREFVMGYKLISMQDGSFAYMRESNGEVLPYRFDIASDFNEFGFAMVGLGKGAAWLNRDFKVFRDGWVPLESVEDGPFVGIGEFSGSVGGEVSPIVSFKTGEESIHLNYLNTLGNIQSFVQYDGQLRTKSVDRFVLPRKKIIFRGMEELNLSKYAFDGSGHLHLAETMLFSRGFFCTFGDLIAVSREKGFLTAIEEEAKAKIIKMDK